MKSKQLSNADKNLKDALEYLLVRINKHEHTTSNSPTYDIDINCTKKKYKIDHIAYATIYNLYKLIVDEV